MAETCASCLHIGRAYWDNGFRVSHLCGKSSERRSAQFRSCGDRSTDFLNEFCKFFDAEAKQPACQHYASRPIAETKQVNVLIQIQEAGGKADFQFFSEDNRLAEGMSDIFTKHDWYAKTAGGMKRWGLTAVGEVEIHRFKARGE